MKFFINYLQLIAIMKAKIIYFIAAVCIFSVFNISSAHSPVPSLFDETPPLVYRNETLFTKIPATLGDVIVGLPASIVGGVIGIPIGIVMMPQHATNILFYPYIGGVIVGMFGRAGGAAVLGFPFFVLQKTFYDFPKFLFKKDEKQKPESDRSQNPSKIEIGDTLEPIEPLKPLKEISPGNP